MAFDTGSSDPKIDALITIKTKTLFWDIELGHKAADKAFYQIWYKKPWCTQIPYTDAKNWNQRVP